MKKILLLVSMLFLFVVSCGGSGSDAKNDKEAAAGEDVNVAIVYSTGGLGDNSFNDSAKRGLERAKTELGIQYSEYEPSNAESDAETQLRAFSDEGTYNLIIATGFTMKSALESVAADYPEQKYAIIDEESTLPNVVSLKFKEHEGSFLMGALAASMTKSNKIGFVGGIEAPLIQKFDAGYTQGAKYINPKVEVVSVYINGENPFNDIAAGKTQTQILINNGVDVVYHAAGGTGKGVIEAAQQKGIYAIGVDSNQDGLAEGVVLTSMMKNVDNAVFALIQELQKGSYTPGLKEFGIAEDGVGTTDFKFTREIIGEDKISKLEEIKEKIKSGEIKVSPTK